jgi:hypothetical protein
MSKKATKEDIAKIEYMLADLDPNKGEASEAAKERYLKQINDDATAIIDSGNGIQALWKLEESIALGAPIYNGKDYEYSPEEQAKVDDVEARSAALMVRLGSKAGTQNIDRIFRLPGTTNLPTKAKLKDGRVACPTRLISFNGATYPLDAFALPEKETREAPDRKSGGEKKLPRELLNMLYLSGDQPAGYPSRSELLYAFLCAALRKWIDENEVVQACIDPAFAGCSIYEHVQDNGGEDYVKRQIERVANDTSTTDGKITIRVERGKRFEAWRKLQAAMLSNPKCQVFVRGGKLVEPLWRWEKAGDKEVLAAQFVPYNATRLSDVVARHAVIFTKSDARAKKPLPIDPPTDVIETLLFRGDWDFPTVVGIINTPTMRPDGSLLLEPGYDPTTQFWYKPSGDVELPPIPERPSHEQAVAALELLNGLLDGFPFEGEAPECKKSVSRSVALAGMMTTVLRGAMPVTPLFMITAPEPRTGKTYLVDMTSVLSTGHTPVPIAGHEKKEELEKRIETAALSGRAILHLNNLPNGMVVMSEALSQFSTEGQVYIRKLGRHEEGLCDCRGTTIFLNGNNILVAADLVPRTMVCRLNANAEQPGTRTFSFNPIERVRRDRGAYLAAIFTIARAFIAAGSPRPKMIAIAGYEDWSRFVQQPLIWLGMEDPRGGIEDMRAMDTTQEELQGLIDVLRKYFAVGQGFTAAECGQKANEQASDTYGKPYYVRQDLRDLMTFHGKINTTSFGRFLMRHLDRVYNGWSLKLGHSAKTHSKTYKLAFSGDKAPVPIVDDDQMM